MKKSISLLILLAAGAANATTVTLDIQFGTIFNASGVAIPDGTLWALVMDENNDNLFTGFGLAESLVNAPAFTADSFFTDGQTLSLNGFIGPAVNGHQIIAFGGFNGVADFTPADVGLATALRSVDLGALDVYAGRDFAFYWFPNATFTGDQNDNQVIDNQVGGIHAVADIPAGFTTAMVLPSAGSQLVGAANSTYGGSIADADLRAVTLVPEPSSALLGAFGALALLRRRRVV